MANQGQPAFGTQLGRPAAEFGLHPSFGYVPSSSGHPDNVDVFGRASAFNPPLCNTSTGTSTTGTTPYQNSVDFDTTSDLRDFATQLHIRYPEQFTEQHLFAAFSEIVRAEGVANTSNINVNTLPANGNWSPCFTDAAISPPLPVTPRFQSAAGVPHFSPVLNIVGQDAFGNNVNPQDQFPFGTDLAGLEAPRFQNPPCVPHSSPYLNIVGQNGFGNNPKDRLQFTADLGGLEAGFKKDVDSSSVLGPIPPPPQPVPAFLSAPSTSDQVSSTATSAIPQLQSFFDMSPTGTRAPLAWSMPVANPFPHLTMGPPSGSAVQAHIRPAPGVVDTPIIPVPLLVAASSSTNAGVGVGPDRTPKNRKGGSQRLPKSGSGANTKKIKSASVPKPKKEPKPKKNKSQPSSGSKQGRKLAKPNSRSPNLQYSNTVVPIAAPGGSGFGSTNGQSADFDFWQAGSWSVTTADPNASMWAATPRSFNLPPNAPRAHPQLKLGDPASVPVPYTPIPSVMLSPNSHALFLPPEPRKEEVPPPPTFYPSVLMPAASGSDNVQEPAA